MISYHSADELAKKAAAQGKKISDLVIQDQAEQLEKTQEELVKQMRENYTVMKESVQEGAVPGLRSASGLTGGDAYKLKTAVESGKNITGPFLGGAIVRALAVSELNAAMGRIVAAPTAGSCGIIPAAVLTMVQEHGVDENTAVRALFTASAVGMVIAKNASIAGAEGGCQAECGAASAMAAAAVVEMAGGTPEQAVQSSAIALKNILGLVCDPVAGLVEIPCIKRNTICTANAFVAAELALAGITSAIPADEVILAMKQVGDAMSATLKETADGGLAATPTGQKLKEKVFGQ